MSDEQKPNPAEEAQKQIAAKAAEYTAYAGRVFKSKGDDNGARLKVLEYSGVIRHGANPEQPGTGQLAHTFRIQKTESSGYLIFNSVKCADFLANNEEVKE